MRPGIGPRTAAAGVLVAVASAFAACGSSTPTASEPAPGLRVVATTTVFADLVAQVGGDAVSVTSLVPKGGEVHTFDPSPSDLRAVTDADLVVMNGLGLDEWLRDVVQDSGATAPILSLGEGLEGVDWIAGADQDEEDGVNPHLWLDAGYAMKYVERIRDALVALDPDAGPAIEARTATYLGRLAELDAFARARMGALPEEDRLIVSFHAALPYFAAAYGLTVVDTIVDAPGQDPSAGEIATLVDDIRRTGARAVFGEVQFSSELVRTVAEEARVPVVADLYTDTLGDPPLDSYEGIMRWNVERIAGTLSGASG